MTSKKENGFYAWIENQQCVERLFNEVVRLQDKPERWNLIRELYKRIDVSHYNPYPFDTIDWTMILTPIEDRAWDEIRYLCLPFWPQYPIGRYFADFADPIKKIVVECDGRSFHDNKHELDARRDLWMTSDGWRVYRISGQDCARIVTEPWQQIIDRELHSSSPEAMKLVSDWIHNTAGGLFYSIAKAYYGHGSPEKYRDMVSSCLGSRRSLGLKVVK